MVHKISIQNFRCFENSDFEDFKQINLITGKNNVGKTALLEAINLGLTPLKINHIQHLRMDNTEFYKPRTALSNNLTSVYNSLYFNTTILNLSISVNENKLEIVKDKLIQNEYNPRLLTAHVNNKLYYSIDSKLDVNILDKSIEFKENNYLSFTKHLTVRCTDCLDLFSKLIEKRRKSEIIKLLQVIDPFIEDIELTSIPKLGFQLARKNENFLPLGMFGDAVQRMLNLALVILDFDKEGVLLIDEIENGIHYLNQEAFWEAIFKIAQNTKIQIFATTHSLDMICAFKNIAIKEEFIAMAGYMQMGKRITDGKILGTMMAIDVLEFAAENGFKHTRGE